MSEFSYHSEQIHSTMENGKGRTRRHVVDVNGNEGTKAVEEQGLNGVVTRNITKKLTPKEIDCIRRCEFIPGLFKDCEDCLKPLKLRSAKRKTRRRNEQGRIV